MSHFSEWTIDDVNEAIEALIDEQVGEDAFAQNEAYLEDGDHWQDGERWVGPDGGSDAVWKSRVKAAVQRSFTPVGAIEEALGRMANALLKKEPDVDIVPIEAPEEGSEEEERLEAEAKALKEVLTTWWDRKKLWRRAREAVIRSRWAGRGSLRTWIAPGHLSVREVEEGEGSSPSVTTLPSGLELQEALDRVQIAAPAPDVAAVYTDEETQDRVAIFLYEEGDGTEAAELWYVEDERTVLRVVSEGEEEVFRVDLGGRLPIVEMEADLLITEPVRAQQAQLDFLNTLHGRVAESAGFPERYTLNAEPTGIWLDYPPAEGPALEVDERDGETWYLHPAARELGAMVTTDLVGLITDSGDAEKRATPGVVFRDPTDPDYAIRSISHAKRQLLGECKQGHIGLDSTREASGEAYQQARADYEDDLDGVRGPLEGMLRDLLEVVLAWAEAMGARSGESGGILERFRVVVNLNVKSGRTSPQEQQQNNANMKSGTVSQETAMALNGVEDVDAEIKRIRSQPDFVAGLRKDQTTAILEFVREGVSYELAGQFVGIEEDDSTLELLRQMDSQRGTARAQSEAQDDEIDQALLAGTAATAARATA